MPKQGSSFAYPSVLVVVDLVASPERERLPVLLLPLVAEVYDVTGEPRAPVDHIGQQHLRRPLIPLPSPA